jgi:hypothetical protein
MLEWIDFNKTNFENVKDGSYSKVKYTYLDWSRYISPTVFLDRWNLFYLNFLN